MIGEKFVLFAPPPQKADKSKIPVIFWGILYGIIIGLMYGTFPSLLFQTIGFVIFICMIKILANRCMIETMVIFGIILFAIFIVQMLVLLTMSVFTSNVMIMRFVGQPTALLLAFLGCKVVDAQRIFNFFKSNKIARAILFVLMVLLLIFFTIVEL